MPTDSPLNGHPVYSRSTHIFLVSWLFSKFPQSSLEHPDVNCSRIRCVLTSLHWQALGSSQLSVGNQDLLIFSCKMLRDCHIQGMLLFEWGNNNLTMKECLAFFYKKFESIAFAANYYEYRHSLLLSTFHLSNPYDYPQTSSPMMLSKNCRLFLVPGSRNGQCCLCWLLLYLMQPPNSIKELVILQLPIAQIVQATVP